MYNGMMDPEMIRLFREQMSRMSPAELARIQQQMMSNPELMRMASERMKNMRPEDFKLAAEQLKHTGPDEMAEIGQKMADASPEELAAMRAHVDAQMAYELRAAEMLKKQGNELHNQGRFHNALQKYLLAKKNTKDILSDQGRNLWLACSLNLMSCYLKLGQYNECVKEGSEVLAYDARNLKALYRRGQAYKELGLFKDAVTDLSMAHEVAPADDTISELLRNTREILAKEGGEHAPGRLVGEEIPKDVQSAPSDSYRSSSMQHAEAQPIRSEECSNSHTTVKSGTPKSNTENLCTLKNDPETIRSLQNFFSNVDPATLASSCDRQSRDVSPDMIKTASNMISKMSPEELQKMLEMASSIQGDNPFFAGGSPDTGVYPGTVPPNVMPDMFKTATDMIGKMSPEDLQNMFKMASTLKGKGKESIPSSSDVDTNYVNSNDISKYAEDQANLAADRTNAFGESSSSHNTFSNLRNSSQSNFPSLNTDLQEQLRNQMKDPAMQQMFTSMIKNMSPEMMANMGEQFGFKLSREDAAKAQQAMSSLSPEDLDKMMRWADRIQNGVEGVKKTKNWLLGKPGMILAICMLILAVILHRLGFIGG